MARLQDQFGAALPQEQKELSGLKARRVEPAAAIPRPQRLPQAHRAAHRAGYATCSHLNAWPEDTQAQLLTLHQLSGRLQRRGSIARSLLERAKCLVLLQHLRVSVGPCIVPFGCACR